MSEAYKSRLLLVIYLTSLLVLLLTPLEISFAQTTTESIWQQNVEIIDEGIVDNAELTQDPNCETLNIAYRRVSGVLSVDQNGNQTHNPLQEEEVTPTPAEQCVTSNRQGVFANGFYSPTGNPRKMLKIGTASTSFSAAPIGNTVIAKIRDSSRQADRLSINYNLRFGKLFYVNSGPFKYDIHWDYGTLADPLRYTDDKPVLSDGFRTSQNGRYAVMQLRSGLIFVRVDLQTQEMTPFYRPSSVVNYPTFAISNDGRYAYTNVDNKVIIHDLSTCEISYERDEWVRKLDASQPTGCSSTGDIRQGIRNGSEGYIPGRSQTLPNYPGFSPNGSEITLYSSGAAGWKKVVLRANDYVSSARGYIAMGDSFSSGEGDTEGGTWYEPGTDEQGDTDTFLGRNLCHLSRRSYPYLIAKELDFLSRGVDEEGNPAPVTPLPNGLFHSIACSGAKIHNITGGSELELFAGTGGEDTFAKADNQYSNNYFGNLDNWQPGRIKQLDAFNSSIFGGYLQPEESPKTISIGIGGNDADFGGIIESCVLSPTTCVYAQSGSLAASELALTIAKLKPRLTDLYKEVKLTNPDAGIYVHGYPIFTQGYNGNCGNNVRLDQNETALVEEGVKHMNNVVQAAAKEAGVFYVDVTNILTGRNLCSGVSDENMTVNGITAGNDINNVAFGVFSSGLCFIRTGCLGKESYHPNQKAHEFYKSAIIEQTTNLTAAMPEPELANYPTPDIFFGQVAADQIAELNGGRSYTIVIPEPKPFIITSNKGSLEILQNELLAGSELEVLVESTPRTLGTFMVSEDGVLEESITLPEDLEPGPHRIFIKGVSKFGETISYYEQIIVGNSANDFDGDGVENSADSCSLVPDSGIDLDEDGIDDVCDEDIQELEPEEPEEPEEKPKRSWRERVKNFFRKIRWFLFNFFQNNHSFFGRR